MRFGHNKFLAESTVVDGIKFPSKLEANLYRELIDLCSKGLIKFFLRQCPFHLPGDSKYVTDFVVIKNDGVAVFLDAKGRPTPMFKLKKKQVEEIYGADIIEVSANEIEDLSDLIGV